MGVRITPQARQPVQASREFFMQVTSAESNVLTVAASLGMRTKVLTRFVAGSPIADMIKRDLRGRGIEYEGPEVPQGGPWGYRHQFNIADSGFGMRGPRVWNDRAGEVGCSLTAADFDLEKLFREDGVEVLHLSGLIAAMSKETAALCVALAHKAKECGTRISFDLNYRASFWDGRETGLAAAFREIAGLADVLVGNEEDFQLALGFDGPDVGGENLADKVGSFKDMIDRVRAEYPGASYFATTLREAVSANEHLWGAVLFEGGGYHIAEPRRIPVLDRIGGGDGFVGGLLYGILRGWAAEDCMRFGWATGAMAATMLVDYALPADEEQAWSVWQGNARVKR
jgi:2-dehydro-3-deoxygluconokinase